MPQCSDYGTGWVGEYPNCTYQPQTPGGGQQQPAFAGTVTSLGFQSLLPSGEDYSEYFDPYDPEQEDMAKRRADIDIGQLGSAWDLRSGQLGETWRVQRDELGEQWAGQRSQLGAGARRGFQDVTRMGEQMLTRGRGLTFGGQRQRQAEEEVSGAYRRSFGAGQTAYERAMGTGRMNLGQALETGQLALQQATTDIYQGLESDIFGYRESWEDQQRDTLNMLLGQGLMGGSGTGGTGGTGGVGGTGGTGTNGNGTGWNDPPPGYQDPDDPNTGWVTCCDGSEQPAAYMCGPDNAPADCYGNEKGSGTPLDPNTQVQCEDGTFVNHYSECPGYTPGGGGGGDPDKFPWN